MRTQHSRRRSLSRPTVRPTEAQRAAFGARRADRPGARHRSLELGWRSESAIRAGPQEVALPPHFEIELELIGRGFPLVAGVDEAGRGPLAGPVSAAAVILDPEDLPEGLDDSKVLTAERRDILYEVILARAVAVGVGFASVAEIDRINIRQASFAAMRRAVAALSLRPTYVLVDGNDPPSALPCPVDPLIKGDGLSVSIAAASIVAKVTRDRLMVRLHDAHPEYGFCRHKGYATLAHRTAILTHGLTAHHRRLFCSTAA